MFIYNRKKLRHPPLYLRYSKPSLAITQNANQISEQFNRQLWHTDCQTRISPPWNGICNAKVEEVQIGDLMYQDKHFL